MFRSLAIAVSLCLFFQVSLGQEAKSPAYHGASPFRTLDLKDPKAGSLQKSTSFDFNKFTNAKFIPPRTRKCGTTDTEKTRSLNQAVETVEQFEQWMERKTNLFTMNQRASARGQEVYTLPVVVHVIYSRPEENISSEQILSQIEVLNEDYRRTNEDQDQTPREFRRIAVDTGIEFCMASIDPNGNPTDGINRVSMSGAPFTESFMNGVVKPQTIWDPTRYMNIWVANLSNGILGFAQFPESGNLVGLPGAPGGTKTDGVVLNYLAMGTTGTAIAPFNHGRTATHEVGHFLGLRHIWGDGPCGKDDFCDDTPEAGQPTFNCPPTGISCNGERAMIENFMDYTDDACMNLFTNSQRLRMRTVMESSPRRQSLLNSKACGAGVLPPEPDFTADVRLGFAGLRVQFTDESSHEPETWNWSFPGGRPSSSGRSDPRVTYKEPGVYRVSLTVANRGGSKSISKEGFIEVLATYDTIPYLLTFEGETFPPKHSILRNIQDDKYQWKRTEKVSGRGQGRASLMINHFDNNLLNSSDWFVSPLLKVNQEGKMVLSFDLAYAPFNDNYTDTLGVFIATDYGTTFKNIYYKGGKTLSSREENEIQKAFVPQSQDWKREIIDLSAYQNFETVQVAFVSFNGHGNNLFLDNVYLGPEQGSGFEPSFTQNSASLCPGQSVTFEDQTKGKVEKRIWSFPGGFPASDTGKTPQVRYDSAGTYDVSLTIINEYGERSTEKRNAIRISQSPDISLKATKTRICKGEAIELIAEADVPYKWYLEPGIPPPLGDRITLNPKKDFVYRIETLGPGACKAKAEVAVRVDQEKTLTLTPPSKKICKGESVDIHATGAISYHWLPTMGLSSPNSGITKASPTLTTTYVVTGTTVEGCVIQDSVTIEVQGGPENLDLKASKQKICQGEKISLKAQGASSYNWSPSTGLNKTDGASVTARPDQSTTYRVSGITSNGCEASRSLTIEVDPGPALQVMAAQKILCPGEEVFLNASGADSYTWIAGEGLLDRNGPAVYARPLRPTTYTLVGKTGFNCTDTARVEVEVLPASRIELRSSKSSACLGESITVFAEGGNRYQWFQDGNRLDLSLRTQEYSTILYDPTKITVLGRDERGCESQASIDIALTNSQVETFADFEASRSVTCAGQEIEFRSLSRGATQFFWEFKGGTPRTSTEENPVVVFEEEGFYDVSLVVRGCDGRAKEETKEGYIVISQPFEFELSEEVVNICKGSDFTVKAKGARTYEWFPSDGLDQSQSSRVRLSPRRDMTYTVIGTSDHGCISEKTLQVNLTSASDPVQIENISPVICEGEAVSLRVNDPGIDLKWEPSRDIETSGNGAVLATPSNTTLYTVSRTDIDGCQSQDTITVKVLPKTNLTLIPEKVEICPGNQTTLKVLNEGVFTWAPAYGLSSTLGQEVIAYPGETTTYTVSGKDESGCPSEGRVIVEVKSPSSIQIRASKEQLCLGDSTAITVSGASNVSWSPSRGLSQDRGSRIMAFPRETTTYTLTSANDECSAEKDITIEVVEAEPVLIEPSQAEICQGDTLTLLASNSSSYEWEYAEGISNNFGPEVQVFPRQTTSFTVSGYDSHGCNSRGSVTVTVREGDFIEAEASAASFCEGDGEISLSARGGVSYRWLPASGYLGNTRGIEVKVAPEELTIYKVVGEDEFGCKDTAIVKVGVGSPLADFRASRTEIDLAKEEESGAVAFTDLTPNAESWLWDFGDGSVSRDQDPQHIYTQPGNYTVTLQVSDGTCSATATEQITVKNSSSLFDISEDGNIKVNEGDQNGLFLLSIESPRPMALEVRLLNAQGAQLLAGILQVNEGIYQQEINLIGYEKGTYTLQILDGADIKNLELNYD